MRYIWNLIKRSSKLYRPGLMFYVKTLSVKKTPQDSDANIGMRRMYSDLMFEEKKHVERFRELINEWEQRLKEL
jgi:hypothetical protein